MSVSKRSGPCLDDQACQWAIPYKVGTAVAPVVLHIFYVGARSAVTLSSYFESRVDCWYLNKLMHGEQSYSFANPKTCLSLVGAEDHVGNIIFE